MNAPAVDPRADPRGAAPVHSRAFRRRRAANWLVLGVTYATMYMGRYNLSFANKALSDAYGWDKTQIGAIITTALTIYGFSAMFNGPIADKIGGRRAMLIGAGGTVVFNALFGLGGYLGFLGRGTLLLTYFATVWGLNAYFQSFGALSIVKINAQWFHISERGTFAAIFGILIRLGLIFAFSGVPLIAQSLPWYWGFWIPAGGVALLGLLNYFFVAESPEDAGFATVDTGDADDDDGKEVRIADVVKKVLTSRPMWTIAIASVMIGFVRRSIVDSWWPAYFKEIHHVGGSDTLYQATAWSIAIAGIIGGFVLGPLSDRVFQSRRAPVVVIGFAGMAVMLCVFYASDALGLGGVGACASLAVLSFFVNGSHGMIGGAASMDFGGKRGAATAAGLFDGMQYFFAAPFTGYLVGQITQNYGWQVWKLWPVPFAIVGAAVMATLWNVTPRRRGGGH